MAFVTLLEAPHHLYNATVVLQKTPKSPVYDSVFACVCVSWWKLKWVEVLEWECNCVCESVHYTLMLSWVYTNQPLSKIGITKTTRHPLFFWFSLTRGIYSEMEVLNGIFSRGLWAINASLFRLRVFFWFSTLIFAFYKILFMNRLKFSLLHGFL